MTDYGRYVGYELAMLALTLLGYFCLSRIFEQLPSRAKQGSVIGLRIWLIPAVLVLGMAAQPLITSVFFPGRDLETWQGWPSMIVFCLILLCPMVRPED